MIMEKSHLNLSQIAAYISIIATVMFLVLLTVVHVLKPEIDPSWRMISEYEIGRFGWLMQIAFFSLAVSSVSLFVAIRPHMRTMSGYIGLALLLVTVIGVTIGAIFPSDPITTSEGAWSTAGKMHNLGGLFSVLTFPFVAAFITWGLVRRNQAWVASRRLFLSLTVLIWLSLGAYFLVYYLSGSVGPDTPIGWPNRVFIVAYSVWLIVIAWKARKVRHQS